MIIEKYWSSNSHDKAADAKAGASMAALVGNTIAAKPFPRAAQRLAQLTQDSGCRLDDVVGILETGPGLCSHILRLVNSAGFALRIPCSSIHHAAALAGMARLNQVATTAAVLPMYDGKENCRPRSSPNQLSWPPSLAV